MILGEKVTEIGILCSKSRCNIIVTILFVWYNFLCMGKIEGAYSLHGDNFLLKFVIF